MAGVFQTNVFQSGVFQMEATVITAAVCLLSPVARRILVESGTFRGFTAIKPTFSKTSDIPYRGLVR